MSIRVKFQFVINFCYFRISASEGVLNAIWTQFSPTTFLRHFASKWHFFLYNLQYTISVLLEKWFPNWLLASHLYSSASCIVAFIMRSSPCTMVSFPCIPTCFAVMWYFELLLSDMLTCNPLYHESSGAGFPYE